MEIAEGVNIKIARGAVGNIVTKVDEPEESEQPTHDDDQPGSTAGTEEN